MRYGTGSCLNTTSYNVTRIFFKVFPCWALIHRTSLHSKAALGSMLLTYSRSLFSYISICKHRAAKKQTWIWRSLYVAVHCADLLYVTWSLNAAHTDTHSFSRPPIVLFEHQWFLNSSNELGEEMFAASMDHCKSSHSADFVITWFYLCFFCWNVCCWGIFCIQHNAPKLEAININCLRSIMPRV